MLSGYKTYIFAALLALISVLDSTQVTGLIASVPDEWKPSALAGIAFVVAILRTVTKAGK
jgi:predicted benzoate:H+ symporter BenE